MKVGTISRDQFSKEVQTEDRRHKYLEVHQGLDKLGLGECLKIEFNNTKEANSCRSSVMKRLKDKGNRNGVIHKSRQQGRVLYFYPRARVV